MSKPRTYWQDRFVQLEQAQNSKAVSTYAEVEKASIKAQRNLESKIRAWYGRFADNNGITISEARKLLTSGELTELKWDIQEYIKYGKANALDGSWMKQLENASAKFHISRLEALKLQTQQTIEVLYGNQLDAVDALMRETYINGYYHTAYEIQKGFNIGWDVSGVSDDRLNSIISKPWANDGKNFSERIWGSKNQLINEVHTQLTQMCVLGQSPDRAISNLAKRMQTSKSQAGRLIMTESAYFSSVSQKNCFNDLDVEKYEIVATLDSKTSEICRELDGDVFDMKDYQPGVTAPPFHVYCRSVTVPWFEDDFGIVGERAARGEDGETYYVPADMKYKEWQKTFVDGGSKADLDIIPDSGIIEVEKWKFTPANNIDEVKTRITTALGTSDINLGRMDVTLANQYLEGIEEFTNKYPQINGYIEKINTKTSPRAFGQFEMGGIRVNNSQDYQFSNSLAFKSPKDYDAMMENYKYNIDSKFLFENASPKSSAIHELTHALASKITATASGSFLNGKYVTKRIDRSLSEFIGCATGDIVRKTKKELYGKLYGKEVYDGMKHLGSYALANDDEMIAQCISYEFMNESKPFSAKVKEMFDEIVKGAFE